MNPITFQFKESPNQENLDYSLIEYDNQLNLSIDKKTKQPAIDFLTMDTETVTRANRENTDSDNNGVRMLMDTSTFTKAALDITDTDRDRLLIQALMDTATLTESREDTDQDK